MKTSSLAIFLGSFLVFFIQPMVGRFLLPVFGGTASVWVICLVAFQLLLLLGYFYAAREVKRHVHIPLLFAACAWMLALPFVGDVIVHAFPGMPPVCRVLMNVLSLVGFPYVLLSANTTLVQKWSDNSSRDVYRLYSVGNAGSFAGLFAYPLLVEPFFSVTAQQVIVAVGIAVYGVLLQRIGSRQSSGGIDIDNSPDCSADVAQEVATPTTSRSFLARRGVAHNDGEGDPTPDTQHPTPDTQCPTPDTQHPIPNTQLLWLLLPAITCFLLTATTTHLSTDCAPLPLLWAVLLGAFLLSYIIGFSRIGEKLLLLWTMLSPVVIAFAVWCALPHEEMKTVYKLAFNGGAAILLFLVVSTCLHAWLCRMRPEKARLPKYYLCGAAGGALGGFAAGVLPPLCASFIIEYPLALLLCSVAVGRLIYSWRNTNQLGNTNYVALAVLAGSVMFMMPMFKASGPHSENVIMRTRDFYNCLTVKRVNGMLSTGKVIPKNVLLHGGTTHGMQLVNDPTHPTTYYGITGGGIAFNMHPGYGKRPLRAGLAGLGVGVMSVWAGTNDTLRCYEISPAVISAATNTNLFTFLSGSKAKVEIVPGDARLSLEQEEREGMPKHDILVVDVFSGDSIPLHMISQEAFRLYKRRLADDGILALHISNWHINLWPVCKGAAEMLGMNILGTVSGAVISEYVDETMWVFYSNKSFTLPRLPNCVKFVDFGKIESAPLPTDSCGSLLRYIGFDSVPALSDCTTK